jgi:hypothetical protein
MTYACLVCGTTWNQDGEFTKEFSHGICPICLRSRGRDTIRRRQRREGYEGCYDTGIHNCGEISCCFRFSCQPSEIEQWEDSIIIFPDSSANVA